MKLINFKNKLWSLGLFVTLGLVSCSDWLEENPVTFISPNSFYQTEEDFTGALRGLYPQSQNLNLTELFADYSDQPESAEQIGDVWLNKPNYNFYCFRDAWSGPYNTIKNANMILEAIEGKDFPTEVKDAIIGEAKCLRAWSYFILVQLFGDVPLRTNVVTSENEIGINRTPEKEVYDFIFEDILDAEKKLPPTSEMGRVNQFIAKAILARIYLTSAGFPLNIKENYEKARDKALEVIDKGGYELMPTFESVFKTETYTKETIWGRLYKSPYSYSDMHVVTAPTGNSSAVYLPSQEFINSFAPGDQRKEWGIPSNYTNEKGNMVIKRPYYNKFINNEYLEEELPVNNTYILTYQTQLIRLAEMYLIVAEAENEINGPTTTAYKYINDIRKRARVNKDDVTHVPDLSGLTRDQFREAVYLERKHELYLEGFAWYDLKRTQTFYKVQEARGERLNVPIGKYNNTWLIPDFEIENNNIPQNPEYQ